MACIYFGLYYIRVSVICQLYQRYLIQFSQNNLIFNRVLQ